MLVNGGGAVTLQFQRSPYRPQTRTVFIPWNQIVVLPPVKMQLSDASDIFREVASGVTPSYAPKGNSEYSRVIFTYQLLISRCFQLLRDVLG